MVRSKPREFNSVEEIFETYIPNFVQSTVSPGSEKPSPLGSKAGAQLAQSLLEKLQREIHKERPNPSKSQRDRANAGKSA